MSTIIGLDKWIPDKGFPHNKRTADVDIHLKYPDITSISDLPPADRRQEIDQNFKDSYQKLLDSNLIGDFKIIGTNVSPRGVKTKIPFIRLEEIKKLDFVQQIFIRELSNAMLKEDSPTQGFYCVKMTVAVEVEGKTKGMQSIEERFVLIRAYSADDAYQKLEAQKDDYAEPYLNDKGQKVRWRIESLDDCYETNIVSPDDLNNPEGVEVYSRLKSRRLNDSRAWNGK